MSQNDTSNSQVRERMSRREMLRRAAGAGAVGAALTFPSCVVVHKHVEHVEKAERVATRGRINQSICYWCFEEHWDLETTCKIAKRLGCKSVELVGPEHWPMLKEYGLVCAIANSHWFDKGMNNPEYHDMCIKQMRDSIDACAEFGFPSVITFTGFREDIPDDVGAENCVKGYKKIVGYAERKKVNLCFYQV